MNWWNKDKIKKRPERITADIQLRRDGQPLDDADIFKGSSFRIYAFVKGSKKPAGEARVTPKIEGKVRELHLGNLTVWDPWEGRGVSSQIMDRLEALIKKYGAIGVLGDAINKKSPAAGMYEKRKWVKDPNWPDERLIFSVAMESDSDKIT